MASAIPCQEVGYGRLHSVPDQLRVDGARLLALREARGWSKKRLAKEAGVDYSTYWRIEVGQAQNPRVETIQRVARALDVAVETLIAVGAPAVMTTPAKKTVSLIPDDSGRKRLIGEVALRLSRGDSTRSVAEWLQRFGERVDAAFSEGEGRDEGPPSGSEGAGDPA